MSPLLREELEFKKNFVTTFLATHAGANMDVYQTASSQTELVSKNIVTKAFFLAEHAWVNTSAWLTSLPNPTEGV